MDTFYDSIYNPADKPGIDAQFIALIPKECLNVVWIQSRDCINMDEDDASNSQLYPIVYIDKVE